MDTFYPIPGIQLSNKYPLDERSLALRADFYSIPFSAKAKGPTVCREIGISPTYSCASPRDWCV